MAGRDRADSAEGGTAGRDRAWNLGWVGTGPGWDRPHLRHARSGPARPPATPHPIRK
jgi:hypothetical protein